jgi:hypothetical protein
MRLFDILSILLLLSAPALAQAMVRGADEELRVRSLRTLIDGSADLPPVIMLGSQQRAEISFDLMTERPERLSYRVSLRNADGSPTALSELEYLDGFNDIQLDDPEPSFNTFVPYHHYAFTFPNEQVAPRLSGTWLIEIYPDSDPTRVIASTTVDVAESLVDIVPTLRTATDTDFNGSSQQLDIELLWKGSFASNPAHDLQLLVTQNGRADNAVRLTQPSRVTSRGIAYEHQRALIFEAGNNFRRFDIASHRYPGVGVSRTVFVDEAYHTLLQTDLRRADKPYYYDRHQFGRYVIRQSEADDSDTEADYIYVHFQLQSALPIAGGDVYIVGGMTEGKLLPEAKMDYNAERGTYEQTLPLKQGHYNYQYLFLPHGSRRATTAPVEGNFYETANEYLIRVFYRPPGARYDRLIGWRVVN